MRKHGPFRWLAVGRRALAFLLAMGSLYLACWIFIAAPTRFLLPLGVGAPEVSAWLLLGAVAATGLCIPDVRAHVSARWVLFGAIVAFVLASTPWARLPATSRRFDADMRTALGDDPLDGAEPGALRLLRPRPLKIGDLFGHIELGRARVTAGVAVGTIGGVPLVVDIYRPPNEGLYPIVVQIYGGAWQRGAPGDNASFAHWLAARGYVVFAIDYRHAPGARWPAQLDDVRMDLAWIRDHAREYDGDTTRVAVMGRSAGAQLALLAAYTAGPLPVRAVVSYYGPIDLVESWQNPPHPDPIHVRTVEETLIGGTPAEFSAAYRDASPISWITRREPPTLLIYGARDHIVELRYAVRLRAQLAATGTTAVLLDIPWADHAFDEVFNGPSSQLALYHTERFLAWAMRPGNPPAR